MISRLPDPVGRACILPSCKEKMITAVDCTIVRFDSRSLVPHYFNYFAQSCEYLNAVERETSGTTRKRISRSKLGEILIPMPPLVEQERIVGVLDEAFAAIEKAKENAEKNLQNARELFDSTLQAIFTQRGDGWREVPLESVATIINGFAFKSTDFSNRNNIRSIKITNVGIRQFVNGESDNLPDSFAQKHQAVAVKKGSIVIALTRTIISGGLKVAIVPSHYHGALLNQRVAAIEPADNVLSAAFLFGLLSTRYAADYVKARVNTLMQPNLSILDLKTMPIPMPSFRKQEQVAEQLTKIREETQHLESIYRQKLAALEELKKSILQKAFSGELTKDAA